MIYVVGHDKVRSCAFCFVGNQWATFVVNMTNLCLPICLIELILLALKGILGQRAH